MGRNGNRNQATQLAKVVSVAIAATMLATTITPKTARADLIWDGPWEPQREREARRRNQWRNRQARERQEQRGKDSDTTDGPVPVPWGTPTDADTPEDWTKPLLVTAGTLLAGGMTVWVLRRNEERDGRKGQ